MMLQQQQGMSMAVNQHHLGQEMRQNNQNPGDIKQVIITVGAGPVIPTAAGGGGGGMIHGSGEVVVVEVKLRNYKGITKRVGSNNPQWDQVSAYLKDTIQSSTVEIFVENQAGNQVLRTRIAPVKVNRSFSNPFWNEDLAFVVPDPSEDYLLVSVEDRVAPTREEVIDESTLYGSDLRPTAKQPWKPNIGVLEIGILGATNLMPMKVKEGKGGTTDAYCVAKYGQKWVRTRTVVDSLAPKWNEKYTWEVFDPNCTVITIEVFDNSEVDKNTNNAAGGRDSRIGKIRIRLSTLESDSIYTHSYPLVMLHPSGVKKMGELHLTLRFLCANMINVVQSYAMPKINCVHHLSVNQLDNLRNQAMNLDMDRFIRCEASLGQDVEQCMFDDDAYFRSIRKSNPNFFRLVNVFYSVFAMWMFVEFIRSWPNPVYSALFGFCFIIFVRFPDILPLLVFIFIILVGMWPDKLISINPPKLRPRNPPRMDTKLSYAEVGHPDELDEGFRVLGHTGV